MGNRSYLITPTCSFETNNCLVPGWFLLFTKDHINRDFVNSFIEQAEIEEVTEDNDLDKEDGAFMFKTTAKDALALMEKRLDNVSSPYIRQLLQSLHPLKECLQNSPPDGEVKLDCYEFLMLGEDEECIHDLEEAPHKLEEAIQKEDIRDFNELIQYIGIPVVELTGDIEVDKKKIEEEGLTLEEFLTGFQS